MHNENTNHIPSRSITQGDMVQGHYVCKWHANVM